MTGRRWHARWVRGEKEEKELRKCPSRWRGVVDMDRTDTKMTKVTSTLLSAGISCKKRSYSCAYDTIWLAPMGGSREQYSFSQTTISVWSRTCWASMYERIMLCHAKKDASATSLLLGSVWCGMCHMRLVFWMVGLLCLSGDRWRLAECSFDWR